MQTISLRIINWVGTLPNEKNTKHIILNDIGIARIVMESR